MLLTGLDPVQCTLLRLPHGSGFCSPSQYGVNAPYWAGSSAVYTPGAAAWKWFLLTLSVWRECSLLGWIQCSVHSWGCRMEAVSAHPLSMTSLLLAGLDAVQCTLLELPHGSGFCSPSEYDVTAPYWAGSSAVYTPGAGAWKRFLLTLRVWRECSLLGWIQCSVHSWSCRMEAVSAHPLSMTSLLLTGLDPVQCTLLGLPHGSGFCSPSEYGVIAPYWAGSSAVYTPGAGAWKRFLLTL
ncbi:hypothetical protein NDU88_006769 [Pleurodeles waltl]|uniref:Uncharacterized protein n=1 Tax=Pleurodeles waltl TaxID=8319 RepID=A0AAV7LD08_PLEWA|nr:hypothetical protein NDU88_006769 [Pleurodeles waltl]